MTDFQELKALETFKSLVQISLTGLRSVILLNGGGAVALLTYFGNLKEKPPWLIGIAIGGYALGLIFSGLALLLSYRTQLILFQEQTQGRPQGSHIPWLGRNARCALASLWSFTIGSASAGLGLFGVQYCMDFVMLAVLGIGLLLIFVVRLE